MEEIRITKIDGQEFVPLKDYQKLKEEVVENSKLYWNLMDEKERYSRELGMMTWENNLNIWKIKELEEENKKLKEERDELKKEFQQYKEHYNIEKDKQQIFLMTWLRY